MRSNSHLLKSLFWAVLTCTLALILSTIPLPRVLVWFRPEWTVLALIFWLMVKSEHINVGFAWVLGLFLDVLYGSLFGLHAFALTIVAYWVTTFHERMALLPWLYQSLVVLGLVFTYQVIIILVEILSGQFAFQWSLLLPVITTTLFWPWVAVILRDLQRQIT